MTDKKLTQEVADWLSGFVGKRFPEGFPEGLAEPMMSCLTDAFIDGVWFGRYMSKTESRLIVPAGRG